MKKTTKDRSLAAAATAYVLAWIVGLSTGLPSIPLNATGMHIANIFTAHKTAGELQYLIAESVTGILLISVVIVVGRKLSNRSSNRTLFMTSGILAGMISITMGIMGLILAAKVVPHDDLHSIARLFDAINRLDGPKMWLLALMAFSGVRLGLRLPRWLSVTGYLLAIALIVSGVAYGLLIQGMAWTAYVSGTLLLIWVGSFGITLSSRKDVSKPSKAA